MNAGAATRDISPVRPLPLFGYPNVERISTGVHDPILASALYLGSADGGVLLASLDIIFLDPPTARRLRTRISQALGIPEARVFVACTHTHSAPVTLTMQIWKDDPAIPAPDPDYLEWIIDQTVAAAQAAHREARPAAIAWTTADATAVGGNRLSDTGPTDPECGLLAVRDLACGKLMSCVLIYGMHPTVMHEDSTQISSDFPHFARLAVREAFGDATVPLYMTAPAGDQSPRRFVTGQTFAEAERLGRRLGSAVCQALQHLTEASYRSGNITLGGLSAKLTLPVRRFPGIDEARQDLEAANQRFEHLKQAGADHASVRTAECAVFGAEGALKWARLNADGQVAAILAAYLPAEVQALRIGDGILAGFCGELFVEYALELKRRAGPGTFPVSLVNGELQGYIVTPEAADKGGYEAGNRLFDPSAGSLMIDALLKLKETLCQP